MVTTPVRARILAAALARVRPERAAPAHDPALDRVAQAAAVSASAGYVVAAAAVRTAMAEGLGSGLDPYVLTARGADGEVLAQLTAAIAELRAQAGVAAIGIGEVGAGADRVVAVVAMPPPAAPVLIERRGAVAHLTMPWPWAAPPRAFDITGASARRLVVSHGPRGAELAVDCSAGESRTIELEAGDWLVASVVNVCAPAPARVAAVVEIGPPARTAIEIEQRLFELINRDRVAAGRAPLVWDAAAQGLARRQAARMDALGFLGHVAPDGETLADRVAIAQLPAVETFENVGLADGPGRAHLAFMASAGHRHNLLAERARRGAVGIAASTREPGSFYVTEICFEPLRP